MKGKSVKFTFLMEAVVCISLAGYYLLFGGAMAHTTCEDETHPWYHGSQQQLTVLRAGSSITPHIAIARTFSHRPSFVSRLNDDRIKHNGSTPGYLYVVDEAITRDDIAPHSHPINRDGWEWLTKRDLQPAAHRTDVCGRLRTAHR